MRNDDADGASSAASTSSSSVADADVIAARRLTAVARRLASSAVEIPARAGARGVLRTPLAAGDVAAAVADQLRITLDPALVALDGPIRQHGEHAVPLKIVMGGDRVSLMVRVGEPVAEGGGGAPAAAPAKKKGGKGKR